MAESNAGKFATFLKRKRVDAKMSQKEVAETLGYSTPQFISNWERGLSSPPMKALKTLADLYRVRGEELYDLMVQNAVERVRSQLEVEYRQVFRRRAKTR